MKKRNIIILTALIVAATVFVVPEGVFTQTGFTIGRLKYKGGGDWYANPSSLSNLLRFIGRHTTIQTRDAEVVVSLDDDSIFTKPITYMTGHGRFVLSQDEAMKLRRYLTGGGFLFIDDNYGMDPHVRREIKKVFPGKKWVKLDSGHALFKKPFHLPQGIPKIHEHDGGPPEALAIYAGGRMVVFYSFNTDLGDGWEDFEVHKNPPEKREAALQMGTNVIIYALGQGLDGL